jgi:hypothetical protein
MCIYSLITGDHAIGGLSDTEVYSLPFDHARSLIDSQFITEVVRESKFRSWTANFFSVYKGYLLKEYDLTKCRSWNEIRKEIKGDASDHGQGGGDLPTFVEEQIEDATHIRNERPRKKRRYNVKTKSRVTNSRRRLSDKEEREDIFQLVDGGGYDLDLQEDGLSLDLNFELEDNLEFEDEIKCENHVQMNPEMNSELSPMDVQHFEDKTELIQDGHDNPPEVLSDVEEEGMENMKVQHEDNVVQDRQMNPKDNVGYMPEVRREDEDARDVQLNPKDTVEDPPEDNDEYQIEDPKDNVGDMPEVRREDEDARDVQLNPKDIVEDPPEDNDDYQIEDIQETGDEFDVKKTLEVFRKRLHYLFVLAEKNPEFMPVAQMVLKNSILRSHKIRTYS